MAGGRGREVDARFCPPALILRLRIRSHSSSAGAHCRTCRPSEQTRKNVGSEENSTDIGFYRSRDVVYCLRYSAAVRVELVAGCFERRSRKGVGVNRNLLTWKFGLKLD